MPSPDSYLRCSRCGRESITSFASSLRDGWERCCGLTMTLVRTDADIDAAVHQVVGEPLERIRDAAERAR